MRQQIPKRVLQDTIKHQEKQRSKCIQSLENAELLALFLGTGTLKHHVLTRAYYVLKAFPIPLLPQADKASLSDISGIGPKSAVKIMAAVELGRRIWEKSTHQQLLSPQDVRQLVGKIVLEGQEQLVGIYLNKHHEVITIQILSIGADNYFAVTPSEVLRLCIVLPAPNLVLVQYHPSELTLPRVADKTFTKRIASAALLLGCELVDHLILTKTAYFSWKEEKLL